MGSTHLVIGATGLVGSALMRTLGADGHNIVGTGLDNPSDIKLDLSDVQAIWEVLERVSPTTIYIPAAISNVDFCETESLAHAVNVTGAETVLRWAGTKAKVVFFSSAYVFNGRKQGGRYNIWDIPHPIQQYGVQKLLIESATVRANPNNLIVRTSSIFGRELRRKNFAYQAIKSLEMGKQLLAIADQWVNPIISDDLARCVVDLVDVGVCGLAHVAGTEDVTKYEFAQDLATVFGFNPDAVQRTPSQSVGQPAKRPENSCLSYNIQPQHTYMESLGMFYAQY